MSKGAKRSKGRAKRSKGRAKRSKGNQKNVWPRLELSSGINEHIAIAGMTSQFPIGNAHIDSFRVHFPASYVRLPECINVMGI